MQIKFPALLIMNTALGKFKANIERVSVLGGLYAALGMLVTPVVDSSDILRSQIVLAVSALDAFVHDIVRTGMIEVARGARPQTNRYSKFKMPIVSFERILSGSSFDMILESDILSSHGYLSFQHPDKISEALSFFSQYDVWNSFGASMGISGKMAKDKLRLIVDRRNKIAHEADADPSFPHSRWPISVEDVEFSVEYIKNFCFFVYDNVCVNR